MKKYAEKYAYAVFLTACILAVSLVSVCVFLFFCFRADAKAQEADAMLEQSRLENTVENLMNALENQNERLAYHYAASAAEDTALAGEHEAARMYRHVADEILASAETMPGLLAEVEQYLLTGEIPEFAAEETVQQEETEEVRAVSAYHEKTAEKCIAGLFGEHNTLRMGAKNRNGELVFSCSNAYAVIDEKTGMPIEAAISLAPAEKRLGADACVDSAMRFLSDYFPDEMIRSAAVRNVVGNDEAGTFEIAVIAGSREMILSVRRDNGRVVRLTAR